jgi:hypothetical protein
MTDGTGHTLAAKGSSPPPAVAARHRCLYIFLDEGGNLDFSKNGTKYFTLSAITLQRPFLLDPKLHNLKFDILERGLDLQRFHASEDLQPMRDRVFKIIQTEIKSFRIDTIIVEKAKTGPALQPVEFFYPRMLGYLLKYIIEHIPWTAFDEVIVITDTLPVAKKRDAVAKGIKLTLSRMLPSGVKHRVLHHASHSSMGLQVADYCNWAIYRKWEKGDSRSYVLIQNAIRSEFEIFERGIIWYY